VVQIILNNASVWKTVGMLIELKFPLIYWTPYITLTLNLAVKNSCIEKNTKKIVILINNVLGFHKLLTMLLYWKLLLDTIRLSIFNNFNSLELLSIAPTRFGSTIVILKRFKSLKKRLYERIISDEWSSYKEDNVDSAHFD